MPYFDLVVPTVNTVRYSSLAETLLAVDRSVFFTGTTGVGKTVVATDLFRKLVEVNYIPLMMTFSAQVFLNINFCLNFRRMHGELKS